MSKTEDRHLLPNLGSDVPSARFSLLETSTMSIYTQRERVSQGHEYWDLGLIEGHLRACFSEMLRTKI